MQILAGYILQGVLEQLNRYAKTQNKEAELSGLLYSLCTFEVQTIQNLQANGNIPSILAVAANLISRGRPTLMSVGLEDWFEKAINGTKRGDENGKINFPFQKTYDTATTGEQLYQVLHIIDPRAQQRRVYLNVAETDSDFEKNFLLELIPHKHSYITQLLQKQRSRESFTRDNKAGSVDFSFEVPYDAKRTVLGMFNRSIDLKYKKTYVVEIDGDRYHTDFVDAVKDFALARFPTTISHIKEKSTFSNTTALINTLSAEDYVSIVRKNYEDGLNYLTNPLTVLALSPFGIARLQSVLVRWMIANYETFYEKAVLKIAIVEQDAPCGFAAIIDLEELLQTLNDLSQSPINLPKFEIEVFSTPEFINSPLHGGHKSFLTTQLQPTDYDLVLDVSVLRREGVFKEPVYDSNNVILIRSAHYTHYKTRTPILSAAPVKYRSLVEPLPNETYEQNDEPVELLTKLLKTLFRKPDFRDGQLPILNRAMQLQSVIGLLPTGGGKSLTYQLAALLQPGTTVVIDPIRSLMLDQYNGLKEIGIDRCEFINSTLSTTARNYHQNELLAKGELLFVFVSPERFVIDEFRKALDNAMMGGNFFTYAVIDEVHCVSEWGHDFRTPYLNLGDNAQEFCLTYSGNGVPLFGLTATASFDVLADIERELNIKEDDGNAVVRFENTVRDEINYLIREVKVEYDNPALTTESMIREIVGGQKQNEIHEIIKEKLFKTFNNPEVIKGILEYSFENYLPITQKQQLTNDALSGTRTIQQYLTEKIKKIHIENHPFFTKKERATTEFGYGIIAFMPHRHGWLGIRSGDKSQGLYDKPLKNEVLGYFMGSGDDENAKEIDEESFHHLEQFKRNKESLMVATKAFGMGIDKPNVRMTIHINIPQSIESFVQEAGRAGRDGKISTSIILFNNQQINGVHLDKEVLSYFHKNSFKGEMKERAMIYELRNHITYPTAKNIDKLCEALNDLYPNDSFQFSLKVGGANHSNRLFVSNTMGISLGYVFLDTSATGVYHDFGDDAFCQEIVHWVKEQLPFTQCPTLISMQEWLRQQVVNLKTQVGIENILREMQVEEKRTIPVTFTNLYYSKPPTKKEKFILNQQHLEKVLNTAVIKNLIINSKKTQGEIQVLLHNAVYDRIDYQSFLAKLTRNNKELHNQLMNLEDSDTKELLRAYDAPRSKDDTAKAIYRLVSIGVIDSYTIDFQNEFYTIEFTKKADGKYFEGLEKLIGRYTSKSMAADFGETLKSESASDITSGKKTEISVCLAYLTGFIYDKIKAKRLQAIDDVVMLCRTAILEKDSLKQNRLVKDEIYYYFNARFSKRKQDYSLPDDYDDNLSTSVTIEKYIDEIERTSSGQFISEAKHLRGSTMRMLRTYPDLPQYLILKSYSLFALAPLIKGLYDEAKGELQKGLRKWKEIEPDYDFVRFLTEFKEKVIKHTTNRRYVESIFQDVEDLFITEHYATWLHDFNQKFLTL